MISSEASALVQLALNALQCKQKELADRLAVSPTQITKWKKGDHMSSDMENKLRVFAGIGKDIMPSFVLLAGSLEAAEKWEKFIAFMAELANENAETGYHTEPLREDIPLLCWSTFRTLESTGVDIPPFPDELDIDYEEAPDEFFEQLHDNPHADLIYSLYKSFTDVYGFYMAYVYEVIFDQELDLFGDVGGEIDALLLDLAAAKLDEEQVLALAPGFKKFRFDIESMYERWLNIVKERAYRAGVPLRAEFMDLVYQSHDALGHEAESRSLGFRSAQIHPDIYMNELLQGMRIIHQVLPAIMEKLGMDDFELDTSALRVSKN